MQARLRALGARLRRFWTWWRLALAAIGAVCLAVAVAVDQPVVAVVAALVALVPFAILAGLVGDRVRSHHDRLGELAGRIDALGGGPAGWTQASAATAVAVDALAPQAHRFAAMPGPLDLGLIVLLDPDDVPGSSVFLEAAAVALVTAECIAVVDGRHPGGDELAAEVVTLMDRWPGLRVHVLDTSVHDRDTDWFDVVRGASAARHLLAIDLSRPAERDVALVVELAMAVPQADEPWVGARRGAVAALTLHRRVALDEVGGRLAVSPEAELVERRLIAAGYVVDSVSVPWSLGATARAARPVRHHLRIDDPDHGLRGRVVAVPMAAYHCDELVPLADRLTDAGIPAGIIVADAWHATVAPALARCVHPVSAQPPIGAWLASVSALLVMNDWDGELAPLIDIATGYGVPTIAKVEGAQDFGDADVAIERHAYRRVSHVLCQGTNDVEALLGCRTHLVGSSRLERIWQAPPRPVPEQRLAVINVNFTHGVLLDAREEFVRTAIEACDRAGIDHVVSAHPHQREGLDGLRLADVPIRHLLSRASVLVSRFSTVPFEAMARGVPFVYHNPHGERVPTFTRPDGAFDTSTDAAELGDALAASATWEGSYRDRCAAFFARQVDIDPQRSSEERTVEVLRAIIDSRA